MHRGPPHFEDGLHVASSLWGNPFGSPAEKWPSSGPRLGLGNEKSQYLHDDTPDAGQCTPRSIGEELGYRKSMIMSLPVHCMSRLVHFLTACLNYVSSSLFSCYYRFVFSTVFYLNLLNSDILRSALFHVPFVVYCDFEWYFPASKDRRDLPIFFFLTPDGGNFSSTLAKGRLPRHERGPMKRILFCN